MALVIKLFFLFFVLGTIPVQANGVWVTNPSIGNSTGIASSSDGEKLYITNNSYGSTGSILESTNEGASWSALTAAGLHAWNSIATSADGTKIIAATSAFTGSTDNNVYYSPDGGTTWYNFAPNLAYSTPIPSTIPNLNEVNNPTGQYLFWQNVTISADGNYVLLQNMGVTYLITINQNTTPPTATWSSTINLGHGTLSISPDNSVFAATDETGHFYISTNAGKTWSSPSACSYPNAVAAANEGTIYVGCGKSSTSVPDYIYKSTDSGVTWGTGLANAGLDFWSRLSVSSDGLHLLALASSILYYSDDGGVSWTQSIGGNNGFPLYASDGSKAYYTDGGVMAYLPIPTLSTSNATAISQTGAVLNANYVLDDAASASVITNSPTFVEGFNYGSSTAYGSTVSTFGNFNPGAFAFSQQTISGLSCGTTYYYQPFAANANGMTYGTETSTAISGASFTSSLKAGNAFVSGLTTINLTGTNTTWTAGTPGSPTFTVSTTGGAFSSSVVSQTVTGATSATIVISNTINPNISGGSLVISDGTTTNTIPVTGPTMSYGLGSYFTTISCNGADFITSRNAVSLSALSTINLTGINTSWMAGTPGSPAFSVSGIVGDSVVSQNVIDATHATITVSTNATAGTLDVSDGSSTDLVSVNSSATTVIPATASQIYYSASNSYNSGTYIQWEHLASTAKFNFTGSLLNVDLDLTPLAIGSQSTLHFPYLDWQIDNGPWQRAPITLGTNATAIISLAAGLSEGNHTAAVYYEPAGSVSSWVPYDAINITGWELEAGKTISAPSLEANIPFTAAGTSPGLRPKTMMIFGDSITTGYDAEAAPNNPTADTPSAGNSFVQDGWAPRFAKYLDAEAGIVAFSGQGWRVFGLGKTTPAFPTTFSMYDSKHPRVFPANLDYLVVAQATNDNSYINSNVTAWLSQARAIVGPNTYIFIIPSYSIISYGRYSLYPWNMTNQIYMGVAAYKATNPSDNRVFILTVSGYTNVPNGYPSNTDNTAQNPATEFGILGTTGGGNNGNSSNFHDGVHPNKCGHALITMDLAGDLPAECTPAVEAASDAAPGIPSLVAQAIADVPTQISNIAVSTTATTATITWTTDRSATSVVNYGTSATYGSTSSNPNLVLSHSVTLTGLTQGQVYHYQITSVDTASATISAADATFTPSSTGVIYGDVNDAANGVVNIYDAELTAQYAIGLPVTIDTSAAAVDGTGKVDIYDAFLIAEYAVNLIATFPVQGG